MDYLDPQLLEKAGLASIAMFSLWVNYRISRDFSKTINNHLTHFVEINQKLSDSIDTLADFLKRKKK